MASRPRVAFYAANSKLIDRDLSPALCARLDEAFDAVWMFPRQVPRGFEGRQAHALPQLDGLRFRVWLYVFELRKHAFLRRQFVDPPPMPYLGLGAGSRRVLFWIVRLGLAPALSRLGLAWLRRTPPPMPETPAGFQACVCFSSPNDPLFDDIVRTFGGRGRVPVIMVPLNWDNASSKPYLEPPDAVLTWGEQTAALSRDIHGIRSEALGSPRFDEAVMPEAPSRAEARAFLGLDPAFEYILFAGSSFPFDETAAINVLAGALARLDGTPCRIIYRPHPVPWPRSHVTPLSETARRLVIDDPTRERFDAADLRAYQYLFQSVRGVISPYSTMLVEAARYGLPSLALGYNSPRHPEFDWAVNAANQAHLQFTKHSRWVVACLDEEAVASACAEFLTRLDDPGIDAEARAGFANIVRTTPRGYASELIDAIRRFAEAGA